MSTKTVEKKDSYYRDVLRKFTAHKLAMIGVAVILLDCASYDHEAGSVYVRYSRVQRKAGSGTHFRNR